MRIVMWSVVGAWLGACAGVERSAPSAMPAEATRAPRVPVAVAPSDMPKLSPYLVTQWRDHGLSVGELSPIVITSPTPLDEAARELLVDLGARDLRAVTITPAAAGTVFARPTPEPSQTTFVMIPNDALPFLVVQPWVVRLDGASSYPAGPELEPDIARRIDPTLSLALSRVGASAPYAVGGLAKASGCLTDERRAQLVAAGALVRSVIASAGCTYTIFSFEIPLARLVALATLPYIIKLEGSRPMYLKRGAPQESDDEVADRATR
jgi:hypothetical protein